jgi:hypothetical protein
MLEFDFSYSQLWYILTASFHFVPLYVAARSDQPGGCASVEGFYQPVFRLAFPLNAAWREAISASWRLRDMAAVPFLLKLFCAFHKKLFAN